MSKEKKNTLSKPQNNIQTSKYGRTIKMIRCWYIEDLQIYNI